jgi:nitroreductase
MAALSNALEVTEEMRKVRQARQYKPDPISDEILNELLTVAQWTGSGRNTQPWHFIVVNDKAQMHSISRLRESINWVADAPLGIAIVLTGGRDVTGAYDEGRVSERLLIAARLLGLGGGVAWYGDDEQQEAAKELLGVPAELTTRSIVVLGYPITSKDPRPNPAVGGRHPLSEIVSYGRMGSSEPAS